MSPMASTRDAPLSLSSPLAALPGVGPGRAAALATAGYRTVEDLLWHLPAREEDRREVGTVAGVLAGLGAAPGRSAMKAPEKEKGKAPAKGVPARTEVASPAPGATAGGAPALPAVTLRGRLSGMRLVRTRRRGFSIVHGRLADESGTIPVVWFNRPYLARQVDPAETYLLHGTVRTGREGPELLNPTCEPAGRALHGSRLVPVYPAIRGLGAPLLRRLLDAALAAVDPRRIEEPLPAELLARHGLPPLGEAFAAIHRPEAPGAPHRLSPSPRNETSPQSSPFLLSESEGSRGEQRRPALGSLAAETASLETLNARRTPAHQRLIYGELLELQLEIALLRQREVRQPRTLRYRLDVAARDRLRGLLPFPPTAAQERAVGEILDDLAGPHPMLRLLQGDVGSGKTAVAAQALAAALESGFQGAFMAPTELLAEQHFASLGRLLGGRYRLGLVTSSAPGVAATRAALAAGEVQLAVGTHALIQEGVRFRRLALAVVDEQHRFGVAQRQLLAGKGERPDLLVMTATPIPRSLALTLYGDLDTSTLDELPPGRRPVETELAPARRRREVYARLARALEGGARAYVVFPRIEEGGGAASVAEVGERVRRFLGAFSCAVVHGRLPAAERERAMRAFAAGEVQVLLATTVIEVGVDVPEATWMVIESAERFGLAQLHQLRGRVGRGAGGEPPVCVALVGRASAEARERLAVFAGTTDGFAIAEADLAQRGPGELLGTRQAGLPALRAADLRRDLAWLERARDDAREVLARSSEPAFAALLARLASRAGERAEAYGAA